MLKVWQITWQCSLRLLILQECCAFSFGDIWAKPYFALKVPSACKGIMGSLNKLRRVHSEIFDKASVSKGNVRSGIIHSLKRSPLDFRQQQEAERESLQRFKHVTGDHLTQLSVFISFSKVRLASALQSKRILQTGQFRFLMADARQLPHRKLLKCKLRSA